MSEVTVKIDEESLELNPFTTKMIESTIRGLLSSLRGYKEGEILIRIKS